MKENQIACFSANNFFILLPRFAQTLEPCKTRAMRISSVTLRSEREESGKSRTARQQRRVISAVESPAMDLLTFKQLQAGKEQASRAEPRRA
jgi:hypothetical protein